MSNLKGGFIPKIIDLKNTSLNLYLTDELDKSVYHLNKQFYEV